MLEETSSRSKDLAKEIAGSLDLAAIYDTIRGFYELMNDREVQPAGFDDEAERGLFRAYHIILHLQDYGIELGEWGEHCHGGWQCVHVCTVFTIHTASPPEEDDTLRRAFQFCHARSKSIEINYKNMDGEKILTKVNFQLDPSVRL